MKAAGRRGLESNVGGTRGSEDCPAFAQKTIPFSTRQDGYHRPNYLLEGMGGDGERPTSLHMMDSR